ncbi:MAG: DUF5658 family protein [Halobacteriota archaeon]
MVLPSVGPTLTAIELRWWVLALLLYGVGDYVTTVLAVRHREVIEANPAVRVLLSERPTPAGFAALKLTALGICFLGFLAVYDSAVAIGIPVGIAVLGGLVTVANLRTILKSTGQPKR